MPIEFCFNSFNRSAYHGIDPDLPGQIAAAARAGFTWFGVDRFSVAAWVESGKHIEELAALIESQGMRCWEFTAAFVIADRDSTLASARAVVDMAAAFKPRWVQINGLAAVTDETRETCRLATELVANIGAGVALEYLPFTPINNIASTLDLFGTLPPQRAGVLVDTWHHFRGSDEWHDLEALPLERIAYVQFDDALAMISSDLSMETLNRRAFPGEGEFDLRRFCDTLKAKGFDGVVSVEILNAAYREYDLYEFAQRALQTTRSYW